jgi:hypothetical protein
MTNLSNHQRAVNWLADYIHNNPTADTSFRNISFVLKQEKQYYIKCYLSDNKYLYGSFISEAKALANTLVSSEVN